MRVLHLSSEYPPAPIFGLGRYVHELAEAQVAHGDSVVVCTNSLGGRDYESIRNGVIVKRVHFPSPPKAPGTAAMLLHFNFQMIERILEERLSGVSQPIDVVNAHDWLTVPAAFHICRLLKCPLVTTIHDVIFNKVRHRHFTNEDAYVAGIENWACHISNKVIVLSESVKSELISAYLAKERNVEVVPGGVGIVPFKEHEFNTVARWRQKILADNEDLILYVGRFDSEKGVFVLLDAIRELTAKQDGWRLVFAGRGLLSGKWKSILKTLD